MIEPNAWFRILALCTGEPGSGVAAVRFRKAVAGLASWDGLVERAEHHGLDPLVRAHLAAAGIAPPADVANRLRARWLQQAHASAVRAKVVAALAGALHAEAVPFLALKGAALAHLAYRSPQLRPMRDVDVLVRARDARRAHDILHGIGFSANEAAVDPNYHHLPGLRATVDGATITIELHVELLRPTWGLERLRYEDVAGRAQPFNCGGTPLRSLGREELLWHAYTHAFVINVLSPSVRLISVADLATAVEAWVDELDWDRLRAEYGRLFRMLPFLGYLRPWSTKALARLDATAVDCCAPAAVGIREVDGTTHWSGALRRDVLWPPDWWFHARYGVDRPLRWLWYRLIGHPLRLVDAAAATGRTRLCKRLRPTRRHRLLD